MTKEVVALFLKEIAFFASFHVSRKWGVLDIAQL